jgi:hypothetical protein
MGGAGAVSAVAFLFARKRQVSLLGAPMQLLAGRRMDRRLVVGSTLFGVGAGIAGFCPGPVLVALGMGEVKALAFASPCSREWQCSRCSRAARAFPPARSTKPTTSVAHCPERPSPTARV